MHLSQKNQNLVSIETNKQVAEAWERFTDNGDIQSSSIRQVIRQSWIKSRKLGIDHGTERAPTVISSEEIEFRLRTEDLTQAGIAALSNLSDLLHDTRHVVALADHNGHILYAIGHQQIRDKLENINFMPGGAWAEAVVGPNGVGTPLQLGRPELVMGHEHYCQGWQPWVCYGAPIYDLHNKSIKGAIDITGPVEKISKQKMALAISLAQSIQSGLAVIQYQRQHNLREETRHYFSRWANDGVIILDENSCIVECNIKAQRILNLENFDLINQSISGLIPNIKGTVKECFQNILSAEAEVVTNARSQQANHLKIKIKPVIKDRICIGTCLILKDAEASVKNKANRDTNNNQFISKYTFDDILGSSIQIQNVVKLAKACAEDQKNNSVLLVGNTGTGKNLLAHAIHSASNRSHTPFLIMNCAGIDPEQIETELFSFLANAFIDPENDGVKETSEAAYSGTLFLNGINSINLEFQKKLLGVFESGIVKLSNNESVKLNFRIICAADKTIFNQVKAGEFRSDLFHRISVLEITIPDLYERGEDIIQLAEKFLAKECEATNRDYLSISNPVKAALLEYTWPGNIRELYNICTRWALTVQDNEVQLKDLPPSINQIEKKETVSVNSNNLHDLGDEMIKQTLEKTNHNISKAARILGIDRSTIYRRSRKWTDSKK